MIERVHAEDRSHAQQIIVPVDWEDKISSRRLSVAAPALASH